MPARKKKFGHPPDQPERTLDEVFRIIEDLRRVRKSITLRKARRA